MSKKISKKKAFKLAKKAGFVFFNKTERKQYATSKIDWSCNYDRDLIKLVRMVEQRVLLNVLDKVNHPH